MKHMIAGLLALLSIAVTPVWACDLANSSLPASVKKEIEAECLKAEAAMEKVELKTEAEKLSAYAEVATQVAKAIGIAAQELGIAVNDFIKTPAGILTVAVILGKVFGKLVALLVVAVFVNYVVWSVLRRIWLVETDKTIEVTRLFFFKKTIQVKEMVTWREATEGQVFLSAVMVIISLLPVVLIPVFS